MTESTIGTLGTVKRITLTDLERLTISKKELIESRVNLKDCEFDYALPQDWLNRFADWCKSNNPDITYDLIRSTSVWLYPRGNWQGLPLMLCAEVHNAYIDFTIKNKEF